MEDLLNKLAVTYRQTDDLKPQEDNAKLHPRSQVEKIAESIKSFGFNDPIGITSDGTIIEGHGRYEAARLLGLSEVPTITLDHLTEEERKAYTLIHNKLTMSTGFDLSKLKEVLSKIGTFDLGKFGINQNFMKEIDHKQNTRESVLNILNLGYAQFPGVGKWDIPEIQPVHDLPEGIEEWIGFNYVLSDKSPENKAVHFFVDDYQFERVWNQPDKYIPYLKRYKCVLSPDFSPYGDMPLITQMFNHYRKHWIAAYWQSNGLTVIPTIRASSDPRFFKYYLDGEPKGGVVAYSSMWSGNESDSMAVTFKGEWNKMINVLQPKTIVVYGDQPVFMNGCKVPIIRVPKFTETRYGDQ